MNYRPKDSSQLEEKAQAFTNQKQLRLGADPDVPVQQLAGDESADNRIDVNDAENGAAFRMSQPAGGPFMHPMHDATADPQLDQNTAKPKEKSPRR